MKLYYRPNWVLFVGISLFGVGILSASETLNPGDDLFGNPGALAYGGTQVGQINGTYTATGNGGAFIVGTYTETVYSDPSNSLCAGCLDFVLTVNAGAGSLTNLEAITLGSFDASSVLVGADTSAGSQTPNEVSRTSTGKTIDFGFNGSANISAGQNSGTLVVQTSATNFFPGSITVSDSVDDTQSGYGDVNTAPEPISTGLLGGGLAFLGIMRWRKGRKA